MNSLEGDDKDGGYSWTKPIVARVTEVTAWQSVNTVCLCCLTHCSCIDVTGLQ